MADDDAPYYEDCSRCGGSGHYSYNPLDGTVCYGCRGTGRGKLTTKADAERRAANRAKAAVRRAAKQEAKAAELAAAAEAFRAEHDELMGCLSFWEAESDDQFCGDLWAQAQHRPLTQAQVDAGWKAVERARERDEQREAAQTLGHFGTVGERVEVEVTVVSTKFFASQRWDRASQHLVTMRTAEGHVLKTWTSGDFGHEVEAGQQLVVKGTVKSHGEYQDMPETTLTRVTAVKE